MAMAAGFRSGHGMYVLGTGDVADQAMCPWKKASVRLQQRDAGSRARLCTVVCSTSGRGNQFARRKVKGAGRKVVDKPSPKVPDKPSQKDVRLVEQLQKFILEKNLPPNQLPSIKELMSKGRLDLANAVRSRGYKAVSRMLAQPKVPSGETSSSSSSSSDSEIVDPAGGELRAAAVSSKFEVNLLVGEPTALDSAANRDVAATEEAKDDGAGSLEESLSNGGTPGSVTGGQMDLLSSQRTMVVGDKDGTDDESPNAQLDAAIAAENEGGRAILQPQPASLLKERLVRLTEAVTELSLQERARMFVETGESSLLQEPKGDGVGPLEASPANGGTLENVTGGQMDFLSSLRTGFVRDKDGTDDKFPNAELDVAIAAENEGGRVILPTQPAALLEEKLARLTEAVTEFSFQERARMFVETGESSLLEEANSPKPAHGWARLDTLVGDPRDSAGQGRKQQTNKISTTGDLQNARYSNNPASELQAGESKMFSSTKQWDKSKASNSSNVAVLESADRLRRAPVSAMSEDLKALHEFSQSLDLQLDDKLGDDDSDDSDIELLDEEDEAFSEFRATQDRITTGRDVSYELSNKLDLNGNNPRKGNEPGVAALEREETIAAQEEIEQILSILAKQREIGRLMQRDKELDAQFLVDAQVELDKIKSVIQFREAKTANLRQALLEAQAELLLVKEKAASDLEEAMQMLAEKDALLKSSQLALVRLKKVSLEWWGEGTKVELAGSFNGWQHFFALEPDLRSEIPNFDGSRGPMLWRLDVWLYPGVYEMKFLVDGIWTVDHRREMVMPSANMQNNLLRVDG